MILTSIFLLYRNVVPLCPATKFILPAYVRTLIAYYRMSINAKRRNNRKEPILSPALKDKNPDESPRSRSASTTSFYISSSRRVRAARYTIIFIIRPEWRIARLDTNITRARARASIVMRRRDHSSASSSAWHSVMLAFPRSK